VAAVRSFAELPARIEALAREHERFAVVLLDAFGWAFVQRHADHPLLRRLAIEPVASQFPSTTTAHLTTLYTGLPVEEHGLYEWRVYEPAARAVIRPLPWLPAGDDDPPLTIDPRDVLPEQRFFAGATVLQPEAIADTRYGSVALAGARVVPFATIEEGAARLGEAPGLTYLYWDRIDAVGHKHGPSSPAFDHTARRALDALARFTGPMLVTADHGQIDVAVTDDLDATWPELQRHLTLPPAGSARDVFLHVDDPETVAGELAARLGDRAQVRLATELFPNAGPRLRERLADVCVLPAPGRMAALSTVPSHERLFKGHHGGLTPEESQTWVGLQA
jgi:predicted AlkP superfamily pyrophosphatase or phosphodiesterase